MRTPADLELASLYEQAAQATAEGSKSFYFATKFFPADLARAAHSVYWFCRHTDDLVDECGSVQQGRQDLDAWEAALRSGITAPSSVGHPVLSLFLQTARQYGVPLEYAFELIEGMRMDLNQVRYSTFADLRLFCYRVASVVGLMMSSVIGFEDPGTKDEAIPHAIDLGIAMQLTNILRDIREDLDRGRVYLPAEDLARFGYSEAQLHQHTSNEEFSHLIAFEADRARSYYKRGNAGIDYLAARGRFAVKTASDVYSEILRVIESPGFDVFSMRAVVPARKKYWLTARNMAVPMARYGARRLAFWRA